MNRLLDTTCNLWADCLASDASNSQRVELEKALQGRLGILAGGPGTGKTFTLACLARWLVETYGPQTVAIAAPTGKAAVRCTEAMKEYKVGVRASTIHSLLGCEFGPWGFSFMHDSSNPMDAKFYILDEASMLDADLACSFFDAVPRGGHVLLVGDTNQLLPVGHGAPLRDMIAAGVPCGELTEIRRNAGAIVHACHAIRQGQPFELGDNLHHGKHDSVSELVWDLHNEFGFDPIWDVQLVVAVNEKSDKSRKALNEELQGSLNPSPAIDGCRFRPGDKVVCLKNGSFPLTEDPTLEVYVANGELGRVIAIEGARLRVALDGREVWVPATTPLWDLAYALSVHKSQGSEFPCVIVALDESGAAKRVCDRAWIYTAISRAKHQCVLWGRLELANSFARRDRINDRKTFLKELLS